MVRVCVIGSGIIGLSSAVCIQEGIPDVDITLISEKFSPNTTGDGAAGLWGPYLLGNTSPDLIAKWSGKTHKLLQKLWNTPEGGEVGISLIPCYRVIDAKAQLEPPSWKDVVFGFRRMSADELKLVRKPNLTQGNAFTTFTCECSKLLPFLLKKYETYGGKIIQRRVNSLDELVEFDIIVNCTGLESNHFVNDKSVFPIRGQVLRVKSPGVYHAVLDESPDGGYVIPNQDRIILGGTHQEHDWNLKPDENDRKFITDTCFTMIPKLKNAQILEDFVGLRPARSSVRLEMELTTRRTENGIKSFIVIHNYGHSGSGVTLFWGCALDTCELVQQAINKLNSGASKL